MTAYCPNCGLPVASRHEHAYGVLDLEGWSCEASEPPAENGPSTSMPEEG